MSASSGPSRSPPVLLVRRRAELERELKIVASDYVMAAALTEVIHAAMQAMPRLRFDILPLSSNSARLLAMGDLDLLCAGQQLDVGAPPDELLFGARWAAKTLPFSFALEPARVYAHWHASRRHDPMLAEFLRIVREVIAAPQVLMERLRRCDASGQVRHRGRAQLLA